MRLNFAKMLIPFLLLGFSLNGCGGGGSISVLPSADEFKQHTNADVKIDILFVVDDSGSMAGEQQAIYDNFREFIALFYDKGFDFRIAVAKTSAYGTTIACKHKTTNQNRTCSNATTGTYPYYKKDIGGAFIASDFIARESGLTPKEFRCGYGNDCGLNSNYQTAGTITGAVDEGGDTLETTFGNGTPGENTDHILASSKLTKNEMIDKFKKNILVGLAGTGDERGIESAEAVIRNMKQFYAPESQFPRPNAHLAVIHVGDEGDGPIPNAAENRLFGSNKGADTSNNTPTCTYSVTGPIVCNSTWGSLRSSTINSNPSYDPISLVPLNNYVLQTHLDSVASYLAALKKHEATSTVSVHAIEDLPNTNNKAVFLPTHAFDGCGGSQNNVSNGIGYFQAYMAHISGGQILSKCNDFAQSLALLGDSISSLASSFLMSTQLDEQGGETLKVYIEGINGNKPIPKGDVNGYVYDIDTNRITFYGSMIPPQGALIGVTYTCATFDCQ